ncbi:MAG: hypothetical protein HUK40_16590 [Desulfobacter sp.]|nr:hypothetical protein [Desulfobacter sp.]WDP87026.1 MAG: hypothetical protein HUN05_19430 [Desulfobacter sp.]
MICDICSRPGQFKEVTSNEVKLSVSKGFNPYTLGLISVDPAYEMLGWTRGKSFEHWKHNIVAPDTTNWNICPSCYSQISAFIAPEPLGKNKRFETTSVIESEAGDFSAEPVDLNPEKKGPPDVKINSNQSFKLKICIYWVLTMAVFFALFPVLGIVANGSPGFTLYSLDLYWKSLTEFSPAPLVFLLGLNIIFIIIVHVVEFFSSLCEALMDPLYGKITGVSVYDAEKESKFFYMVILGTELNVCLSFFLILFWLDPLIGAIGDYFEAS